MNVSVIIPCHNESAIISKKIENSLKLGETIKEIIIVDDNSTDETYNIALKLENTHKNITVLKNTGGHGKNSAVVLALKNCSGDIICLTDADIMLPENTVINVLPYFDKNKVGMVSLSPMLIFPVCNKPNNEYATVYETCVRWLKITESWIDSVPVPHGQALFFLKHLNLLPIRQADDVDLGIQTRKKGYKVKYAKYCFFHEKVLDDSTKLRKQKIRRCKAVIDALLFHKDVLFNPKYGFFGMLCYPADLFVYVFSPLLFILSMITFVTLLFATNHSIFAFTMLAIISVLVIKYKSIILLTVVNFTSIWEYFKSGQKNAWRTPREL